MKKIGRKKEGNTKNMNFSDRHDYSQDLPVSMVLKYSDGVMQRNGKCDLQQKLVLQLDNRSTDKPKSPKSRLQTLDTCKRDIVNIQASSRNVQYHTHEDSILRDLKDISENIFRNQDKMNKVELPSLMSPESIKPTTLLDRAIAKHRLQKIQKLSTDGFGEVDFKQLEDGSKILKLQPLVEASKDNSVKTKDPNARKSDIPILRYEHYGGNVRNLPGQPELIRVLLEADPENKNKKRPTFGDANKLLSLYGDIEQPLLAGIKRKVRRRRRMICKCCGKAPGCHQKWCIYYQSGPDQEDSSFEMIRSHTDTNIKTVKPKQPNVTIERSKTTLENHQFKKHDLPDYSSLHRDVYIQALAISRARKVLRKGYEFTKQTSRPFVFSYFTGYGQDYKKKFTSETFNEMDHIFGKSDLDFTRHYSYFVKQKREDK